MAIISTRNPTKGSELKSNNLELRNAASRTTAILTVLFATRMVLSSFSGLLYSFKTARAFLLLLLLNFSISSGRNEKKATSEPDMTADPKRSKISTRNPVIILKSGEFVVIPESSVRFDNRYPGSN